MSEVSIMPARSNAESGNLIADLDEIHFKKSIIKVNQKEFTLDPITLKSATLIDDQKRKMLSFLSTISGANQGDMDQVYNEYFNFIHLVCEMITIEEVKAMSIVQVNRFMRAVNEHISTELSGKTLAELDDEKKKALLQKLS